MYLGICVYVTYYAWVYVYVCNLYVIFMCVFDFSLDGYSCMHVYMCWVYIIVQVRYVYNKTIKYN